MVSTPVLGTGRAVRVRLLPPPGAGRFCVVIVVRVAIVNIHDGAGAAIKTRNMLD